MLCGEISRKHRYSWSNCLFRSNFYTKNPVSFWLTRPVHNQQPWFCLKNKKAFLKLSICDDNVHKNSLKDFRKIKGRCDLCWKACYWCSCYCSHILWLSMSLQNFSTFTSLWDKQSQSCHRRTHISLWYQQ